MIKKEFRQFNMSVEGVNCEKMYFEHLAKLINCSGRNKYNLRISPKVMSPLQYAKRNACKIQNKALYFHVQDIEDYYNDELRKKFYVMIDEMRDAEEMFGICYQLGYSNYTFELWILLHVADMNFDVINRSSYLKQVNQYFNRNYKSLKEFKSKAEFQRILDEFITLDSVFQAINRAGKIVESNDAKNKAKNNYKNIVFYRDNPDVTVHKIVQTIFDGCGVK